MAEAKTRPTKASVAKYLAAITPAERRADCQVISTMLEKAAKAKPVMWGSAIIGFGSERLVYTSGAELDWPIVAFANRTQGIVLYGLRSADDFKARLAAIKPAKLQGGCVYIKRLADVDAKALNALVVAAVKGRKAKAAAPKKKVPAKKAAKR
jgi:hypothetical protein